MNCDLLIDGAAIVTLDKDYTILDSGCIAVRDGKIIAVLSSDAAQQFTTVKRIDARGMLAMPGFVNTHTHIPMAAFRGACEDAPDRLRKYLFPLEKRLVTPQLVYESSLFCLAEMALSGTTTFADMYYFEREVARATKKAGLRALLGETVVDFPAPDCADPYGGIDYACAFISDWKNESLIRPCIAPHAPYTVDADHLRRIADKAEKLDVRVMMHVAEMDFETARFSQEYGSVLQYLATTGILNERLIAAHMLYIDESDIELASRANIAVAHCPSSNAKSGRPISPAWRMMRSGIKLGLATDGPISGNGMDMQGIVNMFPKMQKTREGMREIIPARLALRAATLGGAEALGLGDSIGSLESGKRADIVLADMHDFNMQPIYDYHAAIVYSMRPHNVRHVFVDGKHIVDHRQMTGFDQHEVMEKMSHIAASCCDTILEINAHGGL